MSFLSDEEKERLKITRMIFHVVGRDLDDPILLSEITPPQHAEFFLERVKSAIKGNLFCFRTDSNTERVLRLIEEDSSLFTKQTQILARNFQSQHTGVTSAGVFFVFELLAGESKTIYALIKYDNEDVVRYILDVTGESHIPRLERFRESFVRKPEAMQKIALVCLDPHEGGKILVRDRSNVAHISAYFEAFLQARRVNPISEMSEKLVSALKDTFKEHRASLPQDIQLSGVNKIYEVLSQGGHRFDPEDCEPIVTAIFGPQATDSAIRRTLVRKLKERGIAEETFDVDPQFVQKPKRRRLETQEGVQVIFDESQRPTINHRADGRQEIVIVTAKVIRDDVDLENTRGN